MKILFLSISTAIANLDNRGIYPDLLRYFASKGHQVTIVCPFERRTKQSTQIKVRSNFTTLGVKTFNITKSSFLEKGVATLLIEYQFEMAIKKYLKNISFDLILYATPPITFNKLISKLKNRFGGKTYLMLKDIFPQNAVDLGLISKNGVLHKYFRKKEHLLYEISDFIGCMSPANKTYLLTNNPIINSDKVVICPNAIDVVNREPKISKSSFFDRYKIPNEIPVFLYGGNLGIAQGIDFLIEVLDSNKIRTDCFFLIVGNGNAFAKLFHWFESNKPSNALLIPSLPRSEYDVLESFCDVGMIFLDKRFTIPNFPSRMLSYMECKLPILLATDTSTDIGRIAVENNFGKWSNAGNINDFNKNMDFFVKNKNKRLDMGEKAYIYLMQNYIVEISYNSIMEKIRNYPAAFGGDDILMK